MQEVVHANPPVTGFTSEAIVCPDVKERDFRYTAILIYPRLVVLSRDAAGRIIGNREHHPGIRIDKRYTRLYGVPAHSKTHLGIQTGIYQGGTFDV